MRRLLLLGMLLTLSADNALAVNWIGAGSNDNLSTDLNWQGFSAPPNNGTADLVFQGNSRPTPLAAGPWRVDRITFDGTTRPFRLKGQQITVYTSLANFDLYSHVIENDIRLGNTVVAGTLGAPLTFQGDVQLSGNTLGIQGPHPMEFSGDITNGHIELNQTGHLILSGSSNATLDIYGGILEIEANNVVNPSSIEVDVFGAAVIRSPQTASTVMAFDLGADIEFDIDGSLGFLGFTNAATTRFVTKDGPGTLTISSDPTVFSGTIHVRNGTLALHPLSSAAMDGSVLVGDALTGPGTDVLRLDSPNRFTGGAILVVDSGVLDLNGNTQDFAQTEIELTGGEIRGAGTSFVLPALTTEPSTVTASVSGQWSGSSQDIQIDVAEGFAPLDLDVAASFLSTPRVVKKGFGRMRLTSSNANSWLLDIDQGTLVLGGLAQIARGTVTVGSGLLATLENESSFQIVDQNVVIRSQSDWLMMGHDDGVQDLTLTGGSINTGGGTLTLNGNVQIDDGPVTISSITQGTVSLAAGNHDITVNGGISTGEIVLASKIAGPGSITKKGTGVAAFHGANTYSGGTIVESGKLIVFGSQPSGTGTGPITVQPGATLAVDFFGRIAASSLEAQAGSSLDLASGWIEVDGGTASFPDGSMVFGGTSSSTIGRPTWIFRNGAQASIQYAWQIGGDAGTHGTTIVDGASGSTPSRLTSFGGGSGADLYVGNNGNGILEVLDGAYVEFADDFRIAVQPGSQGDVTIDGQNGSLAASIVMMGSGAETDVGRNGLGTLTVSDGGQMTTAADLYVGRFAGSDGTMTVGGPGSEATVTILDDLVIGGDGGAPGGTGLVEIADSGAVIVTDITRVWNTGTLRMTGGTLQTGTLEQGSGNFEFLGGTVIIDTVDGDLTTDGSELSPGESPGRTTITGNYTVGTGALRIELGGLMAETGYDVVSVGAAAHLSGTLHLETIDGHAPAAGNVYTILTAGSVTGSFDTVTGTSLGTIELSVNYLPDRVEIEAMVATSAPEAPILPTAFTLEQNTPNPFNPSTQISFALPAAGTVYLEVLDLAGRRVRSLAARSFPAGRHSVAWDGTNDRGETVASGVYLYRLRAPEFEARRRMVLLK